MRTDDRPSALAGDGVDLNLDTPALVVDAQKLEQNILRMAAVAESRGVALRPHVKTHKIPSLARRQTEAGAAGITVATVSEAWPTAAWTTSSSPTRW
jgi:D-serine deaminase-like pyridoxal phosphate-dependent protein